MLCSEPHLLWREVGERDVKVDAFVQKRRDKTEAIRLPCSDALTRLATLDARVRTFDP